jgi:hypothetical protein
MSVSIPSVIEEEGLDVIVLAAVVPTAGLMLLLGMAQLETRLLRSDPAGSPPSTTVPNDESPLPSGQQQMAPSHPTPTTTQQDRERQAA